MKMNKEYVAPCIGFVSVNTKDVITVSVLIFGEDNVSKDGFAPLNMGE